MSKSETQKLRLAIKEAVSSVKKENKKLGISKMSRLVVKPDGIYIKSAGKLKILKKGNYKKVKLSTAKPLSYSAPK